MWAGKPDVFEVMMASVAEFAQVILYITHGDEAGGFGAIEGCGTRFEGFFQSGARYHVAIFPRIGWHNIEQQAGDANISEVSGDGRAHDAGSQHGCVTNLVRHGYDILSMMVARP